MKLDKEEAAHTLVQLLQIRDFRKDLPLQQKVFQQELGHLVDRLRQGVKEISGWANSGYKVTLDVSTTFALLLNDANPTPALTACYIDTTQSGTIRLNFLARGLEPIHEDLVLDSPSNLGYRWRSGDILITTLILHDYILQRLFEVASVAVKNETP